MGQKEEKKMVKSSWVYGNSYARVLTHRISSEQEPLIHHPLPLTRTHFSQV